MNEVLNSLNFQPLLNLATLTRKRECSVKSDCSEAVWFNTETNHRFLLTVKCASKRVIYIDSIMLGDIDVRRAQVYVSLYYLT